jgi:hypothetical protein
MCPASHSKFDVSRAAPPDAEVLAVSYPDSKGPDKTYLAAIADGTCTLVGRECGPVLFVGEHPHAITVLFERDLPEALHQRRTDAAFALALFDGELVKEHLGPFVWVCGLDAAYETDGARIQVCENELVVLVAEKAPSNSDQNVPIEQVRGGVDLSHLQVRAPSAPLAAWPALQHD